MNLKLEKERDWDLGVDFGTLNWVSTREEDSTAGGLHSCFGKRNMIVFMIKSLKISLILI